MLTRRGFFGLLGAAIVGAPVAKAVALPSAQYAYGDDPFTRIFNACNDGPTPLPDHIICSQEEFDTISAFYGQREAEILPRKEKVWQPRQKKNWQPRSRHWRNG